MFMLMMMSANRAIVQNFTLPLLVRVCGWAATGIMLLASLAFILSAVRGLF
jgi:hypothetical protein